MTKLGLRLAIAEAQSNLEAWAAKPWHSESGAWVDFWSRKLQELRQFKG